MKELRRKVLLPVFSLTEVCSEDDPRAVRRNIKQWKGREALTYYFRPVINLITNEGLDCNLFPIVLDRASVPWDLATIFLLAKLEGDTMPDMATYMSLADDLGAFKEWLDSHDNPDELMMSFAKMKHRRVTYRYNDHLKQQIYAMEISSTVATRRMGTVVSFYRWMIQEEFFEPENDPWQEKEYQLSYKNAQGFHMTKVVASTDISIKTPKTDDPFDGTIPDGGKLRPLPEIEQSWVMEAARALGNPEMHLLMLFIILTGARIQTAGTLRLRHFAEANPPISKSLVGKGKMVKLKIGPGTGIDTKYNKRMILQVPLPLYIALHNYALSPRAKRRRSLAPGGDNPNKYLFFTQQGNPYFAAKEETLVFDPNFRLRHRKNGGTVRQFLKDHLIPYVRKHHDKNFHFRIHDLRASFGMNQESKLINLVEEGVITLHKARMILQALLGHASSDTTDLYLDYRKQMEMIFDAVNSYGEQVQTWVDDAVAGIGYTDE